MTLELQIACAFALDLIVGDPRWFPHPVKLIGRIAAFTEKLSRRVIPLPFIAGLASWCFVIGLTGATTWSIVHFARILHPLIGELVSIFLIYTTLATRDLVRHSKDVYKELAREDLPSARQQLSMLVGRDTRDLDEPGVVRGAVESVAENLVDGVTAPLFFAFLGGPVGAMIYKAINTLDSMFGHMDERYILFGRASARLDDAANYLPARITAPLIAISAAILNLSPGGALRILRRDGRKHRSPNAGLPEAAFAGALGVQLGGINTYDGEPVEYPLVGDAVESLRRIHIRKANALMIATAILVLLFFGGVHLLAAFFH